MDPLAAELALAETAARRREAQHLARVAMSGPLLMLALAWLLLAPAAVLIGREHLGPFVGVALAVVTVVSWRRYRAIATERGFRAPLWPWLGVAVVALVGGAAASHTGQVNHQEFTNLAGPFLLTDLALLLLGAFLRSVDLAVAAVLMAVVAVASGLLINGDVAVAVELCLHALLLLGACARLRS